MKPRTAHVMKPADRARVVCQVGACNRPAIMCETVPHAGGVSFFHYCPHCWHVPAANGGPSAAERTGVELPDVYDYERRWLAECAAHGETRRKLTLAHHELGEHSLCRHDCGGDR